MAATQNDDITKERGAEVLPRLEDPAVTRRMVQASAASEKLRGGCVACRARAEDKHSAADAGARPQRRARRAGHKDVREVDFSVDCPWRADTRLPIERVLAVMDQEVFLNAA
jgi:hypothetical protein